MTVRFRLCCVTSGLARAGCDLPAPRRPRHGVCAWRGRVLLSWCWRGARAAEASGVENRSVRWGAQGSNPCPAAILVVLCVVKPRRALLWRVCPAGCLCSCALSAACELGVCCADELT